MELPHLGEHCSNHDCKQLDFLPVRCAACHKLFCKNHYLYDQHNCQEAYRRDNQVPECPLCGSPIPIKPGESPDIKVGQHIDTACQSQPASDLKGKIFRNRCSMTRCKKKELLPFTCARCRLNFCITHRLELDHNCEGYRPGADQVISSSGMAAVLRALRAMGSSGATSSGKQTQDLRKVQNGMSDQTALDLAMRASQADTNAPNPSRAPPGAMREDVAARRRREMEEADRALALALAASEEEQRQGQRRQQPPANRRATHRENSSGCRVT